MGTRFVMYIFTGYKNKRPFMYRKPLRGFLCAAFFQGLFCVRPYQKDFFVEENFKSVSI